MVASAGRRSWRSRLWSPPVALGLILVATAATRLAWLNSPGRSLIFDEAYYVNAARRLLGWTVSAGSPYADAPSGLDPNSEHPPLGKVLIAASMRVFGDDPLGWRFPSLVAGLVVILAIYLLVRSTGHDPWMAVYAAGVAMLDNLLLVHSRIATLDVLFLAPLLVGAVLLLRKQWIWAGVACGLALLVKVPAVFGLVALLVLVLVIPGGGAFLHRGEPRCPGRCRGIGGGRRGHVVPRRALHVVRQPVDAPPAHPAPTASTSPVPAARSTARASHGSGSATTSRSPTSVSTPTRRWTARSSPPSPWSTSAGPSTPRSSSVGLIALFYAGWRWWRRKDPLAAWAVVWSAGVFLPYVALSVFSHRISYLFYALPLVPAYSIAAGH